MPKPFTIRLSDTDQKIIDAVKEKHLMTSTPEIMRMALRRLAQVEGLSLPTPEEPPGVSDGPETT